MDVLTIVLLVLMFVAIMLVSGNNLSACVGPAVGSRIISKRFGMLLGAFGFSLGLVVQGSGMVKTVNQLLPSMALSLRVEALSVAILIFVIAYFIRAPVSLSMSLVGLFAGLSVANSTSVSSSYLTNVVILWVLAPVISIVLGFTVIKIINRKPPANIWHRLQVFKILLIILALSTSYVLGSNTIGLIVATVEFSPLNLILAIGAIFVGTFFLSSGQIKRISEELFLMRYPNATATLLSSTILVEAATALNIPLSNTQAVSSAIFGAGLSYKQKFVSIKPFFIIVFSWIFAPLVSFAIGFILS